MTEAAKQARREYYRKYREKNRDRIREKAIERWERKALEASQENSEQAVKRSDQIAFSDVGKSDYEKHRKNNHNIQYFNANGTWHNYTHLV